MADKNFKVKKNIQVTDLAVAGPVTVDSSGVLASSSALPVNLGGTGQTSASAAFDALLPTQTNNANKLLGTDGTSASWVSPGIAYQTSAPDNPVTGQLWVDSDETGDSLDPYIIRRKTITATAGQTVFTTDVVFTDGYEQIYYNGVLLVRTTDYTTSGGTNTVTLLQGASAGDTVEIISSTPINLVNNATLNENTFIGAQTIENNISFRTPNNGIITGGTSVQNGLNGDFLLIQRSSAGVDAGIHFRGGSGGAIDWSIYNKGTNNNLVFRKDDQGEPLVITDGGSVGIGYSAPNSPLEVRSSNKTTDSFGTIFAASNNFSQDNGGSISMGGVFTSDNNQSNISPYVQISGRKENATSGNYAGYMAFSTRANGGGITEKMRITSAGNIGIGMSSPGQKLEVAGNVVATGYYGPLLGGVNVGTAAANTVFAANTDTKIANLAPLGDGLFALTVTWGYGDNNAGGQLYWATSFGGIVGLISNGAGAYFNGSPANQITMSATQHHRNAVTLPTFFLKSDSTSGGYGNLCLYIRFPEITKISDVTVFGKRVA